MGSRHQSREFALQLLYPLDYGQVFDRLFLKRSWDENSADSETIGFSGMLVEGVRTHQIEIDALIEKYSDNWKLSRMSSVDRNVLRIAVYELLFCPETPKAVSINEAIELGKTFGNEDSGAFINGILDKLSQETKRES